MPANISIKGLKEFRVSLKKAGDEYPAKLKEANVEVANLVKTKAIGKAGSVGGVAPKAANSLRAAKSAAGATLYLGGGKAPYALGAEFGARKYPQFKPYLSAGPPDASVGGEGYFLFPSIRENREVIIETYWKRLEEINKEAFDK